jgi:hypothetical protein
MCNTTGPKYFFAPNALGMSNGGAALVVSRSKRLVTFTNVWIRGAGPARGHGAGGAGIVFRRRLNRLCERDSPRVGRNRAYRASFV